MEREECNRVRVSVGESEGGRVSLGERWEEKGAECVKRDWEQVRMRRPSPSLSLSLGILI